MKQCKILLTIFSLLVCIFFVGCNIKEPPICHTVTKEQWDSSLQLNTKCKFHYEDQVSNLMIYKDGKITKVDTTLPNGNVNQRIYYADNGTYWAFYYNENSNTWTKSEITDYRYYYSNAWIISDVFKFEDFSFNILTNQYVSNQYDFVENVFIKFENAILKNITFIDGNNTVVVDFVYDSTITITLPQNL